MTPHRFYIRPEQVHGDQVTLTAAQAHQIRHVLRLRAGQQVQVFDGVATRDRVVEVLGADRGRIVGEAAQAAEPRTCVVAYPSLLQRDKFDTVLQKLTELGIASIVPVVTERCIVHGDVADERRRRRWQAIVAEAAEQSGRGRLPRMCEPLAFAAAISQATTAGTALVADPAAGRLSVRQALDGAREPIGVFVGPEGGYTPDEIGHARRGGARLVGLGPRILRTETASPVLAALVFHERGDLLSREQ